MKYDDIIHLNRPLSKRKKMPLSQRAAQFSPFAALVGHDVAIKESARLTDSKVELDEQKINELNEKLIYLKELLPCIIKVTYFIQDEYKEGGIYKTIEDSLLKIDENNQCLIFNNYKIGIYDLLEIEL